MDSILDTFNKFVLLMIFKQKNRIFHSHCEKEGIPTCALAVPYVTGVSMHSMSYALTHFVWDMEINMVQVVLADICF